MNIRRLALFVFSFALLFHPHQALASTPTYDQCIYALDQTASKALNINGAIIINAPNCGVVVDSSSSTALSFSGSGSFTAKYFDVVGGYTTSGAVSFTPTPTTKSTYQSNPLTFLVPPVSTTCNHTNFSVTTGSSTLNPGTYCNGITISGATNVTFNPGTYILMGGGLNVTGASILKGTGVTFFLTQGLGYNYGPLSISSSVVATVSAPTSGSYNGILFYQDPGIGTGKAASSETGASTSTFQGVLYFPTTALTMAGAQAGNNCLILVADTISLTGAAALGNGCSGGSPLQPPVSVSVTPASATLYGGQTQQFTATVANTTNTAVTWTISPTGTGTINSSGLYTAPATISTQQTVTVTATSQASTTASASSTVSLMPKTTPTITWPAPAAITYGTALSATQLDATASVPGTFVYSPAAGAVLPAGAQTLSATFTPTNTTEYNTATATVALSVNKVTPIITWATPAATTYGTALSTTQLDATASVPGTFVYSPASGAVLPAGAQTLSVTFTPTNTTDYNTATATVSLTVNDATPAITWPAPAAITYGTALSATQLDATASVPGTFVYSPASGAVLPAGVQTLSVTFTPTNTTDYNTATATVSLTVGDATPVITWATPAAISYGTALSATQLDATASVPGTFVYSPASGAVLPAGVQTLSVTFTPTNTTDYNTATATVSLTVNSAPVAVSVTPPSTALYGGQTQQFSASVTNTNNTAVTWTISPAGTGTISTAGLYTAPGAISTQQTVTITATSQENGTSTGTALVTLLPEFANPTLTLTATAQPPYVTGSSETFVVALKNQGGTPIPGEAVTFTVVGMNSNSGSGTTDANGNASYTYTGAQSGNDTIQATANVSGEQVISNTVSAVWIVPVQAISTTTVLGEFFLSDGCGCFDTLPTATPVFVQSFPVINFNPPAGTIPGNTSAVNISSRPFTDVTTDLNGNFTGTIVAQGNGYQAGVGPMETFQVALFGSYMVASAGDVVFNFYDDDGFVFGIGNGATRVSGSDLDMPSVTAFSQYPSIGGYDVPTAPVGNQVVVHFPAPGVYPYEVDYSECCGGALVLTMTSGATNPTGIPPTGSLTLTPNSVQPLPAGGQQAFTVLASDATGAPVPNVGVSLVVTGVDGLELSGTTDGTGHATILYQDVNPGTALVQAVAYLSGMVTYSNQVSVPWTLPPSSTTITGGSGSTINIGISADSIVTLPNVLQLTGTVTDSAGLTPTIAWSQVSGPGTVTFANTQQAVTTASFSQMGNYVVQLSASDASGNSGSVQFPVTVNPAPSTEQGWIGSPVYGSTVSGVIPITLASGVTLESGTLTFYSANNVNNVTVLNPNTTGSGQIGTLDTTTLVNGSYWIQLQATNTAGQLEYSLVFVTVAGNNKPGRVTATVTDLVVPSTGLAINIQRTYDSLNAGTSSDFGYGWSLGTNVNLTVDTSGNVTFTLGGIRRTFFLTPQFGGWFLPYYTVAFTPEPGFYGTLTDSAPGCADLFDLVLPDGSLWYCVGGGLYNPPGYIFTDPSGTAYTISASGALQSIVDRSGNGLTITANGITSTTGLSVPFVRDASNRITQITDPQGNVYLYSYDSNGNLASVTYPNTTQPSTYTYDTNHRYLSGTDARGDALPLTTYYAATDVDPNGLPLNGRLQSVTDALGETTGYAYNLVTNTTTVTYPPDANGNVGTATMVYDSYGNLLSSTDPLGNTTTNVYDANHDLISVTDPLGHTNSYTYDSNGNKTSTTYPTTPTSKNTTSSTIYNQYSEPTSTTDELGNVRTFNYDANYNPQSVTDSLGTVASFIFNTNGTMAGGAIGYDLTVQPAMASQFTYDVNGNLISRTDALGRMTSYTYNSLGNKLSMTTPTPASGVGGTASTTSYQYDALGNLLQTAAPLGRTTSSLYDANGNKISDTDARGNVTTYQYDALNRLITTTYPTQPATTATKTYDFRNNVVNETDQAGNITHHTYDLAGRQIAVTKAYGTSNASTTTYAYYADGRKQSETDALGHTTTYSYDAAGRLIAVAGVQANMQYGYDDANNKISSTDANGNTTQYQYDVRKRLTTTTYPDQTTATNSYDGPGNLASVTDQAGNTVQYTYDAANQLQTVVQVNSPNTSNDTNQYGYDYLGDLSGLTDENGHTTQNAFNLLMEPVSKTLPDGSLTETRQYDPAGNLISLTHFNGKTTTYSYDDLNRLLTRTPDPSLGEPTVSFTYTPTGKRASMTDASGVTLYAYDSQDRLTSKNTAQQGTLHYTYDAAGHVASISSSNAGGVSVSYTYDSLDRLSTVVDNRLQSGQNTTTYTYDPASNVATVTYPNGLRSTFTYDQLNRLTELSTPPVCNYKYTLGLTGIRTGAIESSGRTLSWSYDGIYRLNNETISSDPANVNGSVSYVLDPVGNRSSDSSTITGVASGTFGYNADDELSTESYDANGNTIATGGKTFVFDSENHLTSMNSGAVTLLYDGDGNRVAKAVTTNGVTVTTRYLVDNLNPTGYPQVMDEVVGGAVQREYTYGLQRISQNQIISGTWTPSFYGYDGFGSVRFLTNAAGTVTDAYEYDAFGNKVASTGTTPNNYLYRGEQYDPDLGLYYLRARYYNSLTGRFLSRDPEAGKPADPKTLHKYLYASGDPVNAFDPSGRGSYLQFIFTVVDISTPTEAAVDLYGRAVAAAFCTIDTLLAYALRPVPSGLPSPIGVPLWPIKPIAVLCAAIAPYL